jgi:two-component system, NtrC family, response regulator AtoC
LINQFKDRSVAKTAIETVHLLVVSREPAVLRPLWSIGESNSWHLETAGSGWEALERLQSGAVPDLLLLELSSGDGDGLHVLRWLRRVRPDVPIILICPHDDAEHKREAIQIGAQAILVRPLDEQQVEFVIRRHLGSTSTEIESDICSDDVEPIGNGSFFVAASPAMRKLRTQAELLAETQVPVLVVGESGSGKTSAAQLIHGLSVRSGLKLVKVNCGALPGRLLEEELFGCDREMENGFGRARTGKLEWCEKGTLLLDEIVEMPLDLQHTLLQVLQNKQLARKGNGKSEARPVDLDVRILATTSANIEQAVAAKKFREDLYYCLSAFTLHVPPLRQRKDEIPLLMHHFMQQLAKHYNLPARKFTPGVLEACQHYGWPGNLSELERFVKRYLVMPDHELASGEFLLAGTDAGHSLSQSRGPIPVALDSRDQEQTTVPDSLKSLVQSVRVVAERNAIVAALQKTGWNRKAAARMIKVSYRTLLYKIDQYHLRPTGEMEFPDGNPSNGNGDSNGNGYNGNEKLRTL